MRAEERKPSPIQSGTVTFTLPESWSPITNQFMGVVGLFQKTVNYPVEEGKEPGEERNMVARITLSTITQEYRSLKEMWDSRPPRPPSPSCEDDKAFSTQDEAA